ncbi:MAG: cytochrome c [Pseudomonadota bacterium]|nr:cytochrome c [Pseudomonadota bacterium]
MSMRLFGVRTLVLANFALMQAAPAIAEAVPVKLPELSPEAQTGGQLFIQNCARCHGMVGGGTNNGPPLIHKIYEPNHHGDFAFLRAARYGAKAHHWRFGNMPPQPQVTEAEVQTIITFVREVQRANGIE